MKKIEHLVIEPLDSNDKYLALIVANWYYREWKIPIDKTLQRLLHLGQSKYPFHVVIFENGIPIGTGGLSYNVSITKVFPEFTDKGPWVTTLYTVPSKRGNGIGSILCNHIEMVGKDHGFDKIYLYTQSAETLYLRREWEPVKRVIYHSRDTVIMSKSLAGLSNLSA